MLQRSQKHAKSCRRARIEALDTLPLFFKLEGAPVALIGGTEAAAWKAELLEATGAEVTWLAEEFEEAAQAVLGSPRIKGTLIPQIGNWQKLDLSSFRFVVADLEEPEAAKFAAAAHAANTLYNIVDKTEHCQFQFGSIVNRSPLVIGINTNGSVPVLAQVLRQKIEALIPAHLQRWLGCASKCRYRVLDALPESKPRRAFWRDFVSNAFDDENSPCSLISKARHFDQEHDKVRSDFVYHPKLPPDSDLISALQRAEKIEVKGHFPDELKPFLRREAEVFLEKTSSIRILLKIH